MRDDMKINAHSVAPTTLFTVLIATVITNVSAGSAELLELMTNMSSGALELASEIEIMYGQRCTNSTFNECDQNNYYSCTSEFPNQTCPGGDFYAIAACANSNSPKVSCSGLFDFSVTSVSLRESISNGLSGNPTNEQAKEDICYSLQAQPNMIKKYNTYVSEFGVVAPQLYYGSNQGVFRIFPARQQEKCGSYDNTKRPWYLAATTGPKDIVIVIDTSGSTSKNNRLEIMKAAAVTYIDTLTIGDHVAVVAFDNNATRLVQNTLMQATSSNKQLLVDAVGNLEASGGTNYYAAFEEAYGILKMSQENEFSSMCNTAIQFIVDGPMTVPNNVTVDNVVDSIIQWEREIRVDPFIFLYGLGTEINQGNAKADLEKIACSTGGISTVVEEGGDLAIPVLSSYEVFTMGKAGAGKGFAAWVDPYEYATGGIMGTTVSAPVYDRSVTPPVLIGAVGIDLSMDAMDKAMGDNDGGNETLNMLIMRSTNTCSKLSLTDCEIEKLRLSIGGVSSQCSSNCSNVTGITQSTCNNKTAFPTKFWNNTWYDGYSYTERTCCEVGEPRPYQKYTFEELQSQTCVASNSPPPNASGGGNAATTGIIAVVVLGIIGVGSYFGIRRYKEQQEASSDNKPDVESDGYNQTNSANNTNSLHAYGESPHMVPAYIAQNYNPQIVQPDVPQNTVQYEFQVNKAPEIAQQDSIEMSPSYDDNMNLPTAIASQLITPPSERTLMTDGQDN